MGVGGYFRYTGGIMASDAVEQIKNRLSIVDVVAPYVELHPAGKSLKGKSPFTSERTPSFYVSPDRGMYYCFSTSKGGDIFTFIQEMDGVDFKGALSQLAERAGVELVPEDPEKRSARDSAYTILEVATLFYQQQLPKAKEACAYIEKRGVNEATLAKWRIGFAPDEWRSVSTHVQGKGHTVETLRAAGLVKGEAGKDPYDVFRDRVMFPIFDSSGRVVGYSGRTMSTDSATPKYVNSPDTELFNKSEVLYGYDKAKEGIRKMNFSLIVEGQFDVVMSHQAGYANTVAVSGTALTPYHVGLLQRLSPRVVLALDSDRAGIAAVKRAATLMLSRGMDVKVARLPEGQDPADMILAAPAEYKKAVGSSSHVIEFLLAHLRDQTTDDRAYKLLVRDEVLPFVAQMQNQIDREHFEGVVATALDTTKDAIHAETNRIIETASRQKKTTAETEPVSPAPPSEPAPRVTGTRSLEIYLTAAHSVLTPALQGIVARIFLSITGKKIADLALEIPAAELSPVAFTVESSLPTMRDSEIQSGLANRLELLRVATIKQQLQVARVLQREAETRQDEVEEQVLLQRVDVLHKKLAADPVTVEDFKE